MASNRTSPRRFIVIVLLVLGYLSVLTLALEMTPSGMQSFPGDTRAEMAWGLLATLAYLAACWGAFSLAGRLSRRRQ